MEPMVRLVMHRFVDVAGMGVEIVWGCCRGSRRGVILSRYSFIDLYTSAASTILMSKELRHDRHTVSLLTDHMVFFPSTEARCWLAM